MAKEKSGSFFYDKGQYEMLRRCSDKEDIRPWNRWRKENPHIDIGVFLNIEGKIPIPQIVPVQNKIRKLLRENAAMFLLGLIALSNYSFSITDLTNYVLVVCNYRI